MHSIRRGFVIPSNRMCAIVLSPSSIHQHVATTQKIIYRLSHWNVRCLVQIIWHKAKQRTCAYISIPRILVLLIFPHTNFVLYPKIHNQNQHIRTSKAEMRHKFLVLFTHFFFIIELFYVRTYRVSTIGNGMTFSDPCISISSSSSLHENLPYD